MLRPGARIAVVSPSGIHDPARLEVGMELVRTWGYRPVPGPHLGARHRYTAGTVAERSQDLAWALEADDIDAVWFARGGYGTIQCLASLCLDEIADRPVIGFSDASALFSAMHRAGRGVAVHGPVLHSLADHVDRASQDRLKAMLAGERVAPLGGGRVLVGPSSFRVRGPLVGGNLCVLASLAGTPWALDAKGAIVLLEETAEQPYKIDRLLTQLVASSAFEGARGVALGTFLGADPPAGATWSLDDVLRDLLDPLGIPVVAGLPVGHGRDNHAIVLGRPAELTPGELDVDVEPR
jgi:muramoyltetrapeptide carboxypeptidase